MEPEHNSFFSLDGPLDVAPGGGQVRAANFAGLANLARSHGRDARGIVERHGMEARVLIDPESLVAPQQVADTFEYCSAIFDDPLFGLHFASMQDPEVFGCVTALCRSAPPFVPVSAASSISFPWFTRPTVRWS